MYEHSVKKKLRVGKGSKLSRKTVEPKIVDDNEVQCNDAALLQPEYKAS